MASDVTDVCQKLQSVQLQLHLVLGRNEEVLKHLKEVEDIVMIDGSAINKDLFKKSLENSRAVSKKLEENLQTQCGSLAQACTELEQRTAEDEMIASSSGSLLKRRKSSLSEEKSSLEFQLRTQLSHNVKLHQEKAELDTRLREHMETLKESGRQADRLEEELVETKKQVKSLLDLFEGKAKQAEERIAELQSAMDATQGKAQQYQTMYEDERQTSRRLEKERSERARVAEQRDDGSDEDDGIGPVLISRPQVSHKRVKSAPINPHHIDPLYQSVMEENNKLKAEVDKLREDNAHLVKKSKVAQRDIETIQNHVATCSGQRDELRNRLKKQQDENRKLDSAMTRQASDWISQKKMVKDIEHIGKVGKVQQESTLSGAVRYRSHPIKPSENKPRNIPVESWSSDNPLRAV